MLFLSFFNSLTREKDYIPSIDSFLVYILCPAGSKERKENLLVSYTEGSIFLPLNFCNEIVFTKESGYTIHVM